MFLHKVFLQNIFKDPKTLRQHTHPLTWINQWKIISTGVFLIHSGPFQMVLWFQKETYISAKGSSQTLCLWLVVLSGVQSVCRPYELLQRALQERPSPCGHPYFREPLQRQKALHYIVVNTPCCLYVFVFLLINVAVSFLWKELGGLWSNPYHVLTMFLFLFLFSDERLLPR